MKMTKPAKKTTTKREKPGPKEEVLVITEDPKTALSKLFKKPAAK